ncbi:LPS translocon maturation chaperone LptM [Methylomarinum vadi]|nr:lipoprotein [Methylomarinum vadi]
MKDKLLLAVFISALVLQACGQTGPLYLPDEKPPIYVPEEQEEDQ